MRPQFRLSKSLSIRHSPLIAIIDTDGDVKLKKYQCTKTDSIQGGWVFAGIILCEVEEAEM